MKKNDNEIIKRDTYLWQVVELEIATVREIFTAVLKPFLFVPDQMIAVVLIFVLGPADSGILRSRQTVDVRFEKRIASVGKQNEIEINNNEQIRWLYTIN